MPNVKTMNSFEFSDAVTDTYTSTQGAKWTVGTYREENGKGYRFVNFDNGAGNVAAVAANLAYIKSLTDPWVVTMDVSDSDRNLVTGVFLSVIPDLGYGWIQTRGYHATVTTNGDDDITKGDALIGSAAGDGTCDSTAQDTAPTNRVLGWAMDDDVNATNTVAAFLTID